MKERAVLIGAVLVLFGGLGVWALLADRERPLPQLLRTRPPSPPMGSRAAPDEAAPERALLERAMLGGIPPLVLFEREGARIYGIVVPGRDAISVRDRLRAAGADRVPVILGDGFAVAAHAHAMATTGDAPGDVVRRAASLEPERWLRARAETAGAAEGSWPEEAPVDLRERYLVARERGIDLALPEVAIALLPTGDPAEAPAWLAFGNWEGCPEPTIHVAVLARWRERWGAEVIAIGEDRIELRVARPPADSESALALAREHVGYAPSLARGGTRTIAALAAERVGARSWSFRWPRRTRAR